MKSLARNSLYNVLYKALSVVFSLLTSMYVSRVLLEDGVGKVAYAQNIASYFTAIAVLGFPMYGVREIAKASQKKEERDRLFSELFFVNGMATLIALTMYCLLIVVVPRYKSELLLYLCAGLPIFLNFANIDWLYQGLEEYKYITIRSFIIKAISFFLLFCFVRERTDYVKYALIVSIGTVFNYLFNLFYARRFVSIRLKGLNIKQHIAPLLVMAATAILGNVYNQLDTTMLGIMTTDSNVGFYNNAHKLILSITSCFTALSAAFMPRLCYYYTNDKQALRDLASLGTKLMLWLTIPAMFGVALLSREITVVMFGKSFSPAGLTLAVFAPMVIIRSLGDLLCYQLLISIGQEKKRLYTSFIAMIVNFVLNSILIPIYQQNGAAVASVIAEILMNGFLLIYVMKSVELRIDVSFMISTLVSTGVMALCVVVLKMLVVQKILLLVLSVALGVLVFFFVSLLTKNEIAMYLLEKVRSRVK